MTLFSLLGPARGTDATAFLLPSDGAPQAERRTHPVPGEPFGVQMPTRLLDLPEEVTASVAAACDANLGLAGTTDPHD